MRDIDPQLMRLREAEAKILLLSDRLQETEEMIARLHRSKDVVPTYEERRLALIDALDDLREHRDVLAGMLELPGGGH